MEPENTLISQQLEHTARSQTEDLFFQREWVITSPRKLNQRNEGNSVERDMPLDTPTSHSKYLHYFFRKEASTGYFNTRQTDVPKTPTMCKTSRDLVNIANLPIYGEPEWSKVSRLDTSLKPPLSPIHNLITQHEFTGHFSDWLVDNDSAFSNASLSKTPLRYAKGSHMVHESSQDFVQLTTQGKGIKRFGNEPLELRQPLARSDNYRLLPAGTKEDFHYQRHEIGEFAASEDLLGAFKLRDFIPDDYVPLRTVSHRRPEILAYYDNISYVVPGPPLVARLRDGNSFHAEFPRNGKGVPQKFGLAKTHKNERRPASGSPVSSSLQSAETRNLCRSSLPSTTQKSGDAVISTELDQSPSNLMLSSPPHVREQAPYSQYQREGNDLFLRAGRIYLAYLSVKNSATTMQNGGPVSPYTEEDFIWARQILPGEVKAWLRFKKKKHDAAIGQSLTSNESLPSCTTARSHQPQHDELLLQQQVKTDCATVSAGCSYPNQENDYHSREGVESDIALARHLEKGWISGIESRAYEKQEAIAEGYANSTALGMNEPTTPVNIASKAERLTEQGAISPSVYATGNTSMALELSQNIIENSSPKLAVTPLQSGPVTSSPPSNSSFVTADDDEVSMIRTSSSPECGANSRFENSNSGFNAEMTGTAPSDSSVAPPSNAFSELRQAAENKTLVCQQNQMAIPLNYSPLFGSASLLLEKTPQSQVNSLVASPIRTADERGALLEGRDMLMTGTADPSLGLNSRSSTPKNAYGSSRKIADSHKLPENQQDHSTPIKSGSSMMDINDHMQSPQTPGTNSTNGPSAGTPQYFCQKCGKGYQKKVYFLRHTEKCSQEVHGTPKTSLSVGYASNIQGALSMPSLDSKLPSGNSYCTACNKEFSAVGRLKRHVERHCHVLKEDGVYSHVKETLQTRQDTEDGKACEYKVSTSESTSESASESSLRNSSDKTTSRFRPRVLFTTQRFQSDNDKSELEMASSTVPHELIGSNGSSGLTDDTVNADNNSLKSPSLDEAKQVWGPQIIFQHTSVQPTAEFNDVGSEQTLCDIKSSSAKPTVDENMAIPRILQRQNSPVQEHLQQSDYVKTPEAIPFDDDESSLSALESDTASDDEPLPIGTRSIKGGDRGRVLGYPERTRLFSDRITGNSPSLNSPVNPFEDMPKRTQRAADRRASNLTDNTDSFMSLSAKTETIGADKVSNLIVSLPDKNLCGIVYGKIDKGLFERSDGEISHGVMIWPLYEVPAFPYSTFEFKVTAPDGFNLIATIGKIMPKLSFTHHGDKGWVAALEAFPAAAMAPPNISANVTEHASSAMMLNVEENDQHDKQQKRLSKQILPGGSTASVRNTRSHSRANGSMEQGEDVVQGKKKRKSSRLSELEVKGKGTAVSAKKHKLTK